MLFCTISHDHIELLSAHVQVTLPYDDLERKLPIELFALYEHHPFDTVRIINGPGGFTMLRIGCLVFNTIQLALWGKLRIFSTTKMELYWYAIQQGFLPPQAAIYIGQKKNIWRVRWEKWTWLWTNTTIRAEDRIQAGEWNDFFVDRLYTHPLQEVLPREKMVTRTYDPEGIFLQWQGGGIALSISSLALEPVPYLQPNYLMMPDIGGI